MNTFTKIKEAKDTYTDVDKIIADYILKNVDSVLHSSAALIASYTNTSPAAIIRFSKKIGYKGFTDLKMHLASSNKDDYENEEIIINKNDTIKSLTSKFNQLNINTINKTYDLIDSDKVDLTVSKIINTQTIYIFAVGGSSIIAQDITQKLLRIGKKVIYNTDIHIQSTFALNITSNDLALFISYSGETHSLISIAQSLNKDIDIISITSFTQNTLSKLSSINLHIPTEEKNIRIGAISSRISTLIVTDLIYAGVYLNNMEENKNKLISSRNLASKI